MRALGTDPVRKLVAPRLIALIITLRLLTLIADIMGYCRGWNRIDPSLRIAFVDVSNSVRDGNNYRPTIIGGVIKPLVFAFLMGTIACHRG